MKKLSSFAPVRSIPMMRPPAMLAPLKSERTAVAPVRSALSRQVLEARTLQLFAFGSWRDTSAPSRWAPTRSQ